MTEEQKKPATRQLWRDRAIQSATRIAANGHDVALMRLDWPNGQVQVVLNGKTHNFDGYRGAALRLEAWEEVLWWGKT